MTDAPIAPPFPTPAAPVLDLADRSTRLAAAVVDSLIYMGGGIFIFAAGLVAIAAGERVEPWLEAPAIPILLAALGVLIFLVVFILNLKLLNDSGQTIGKRLLHIKIVRSNGERATLGRIFGLRILLVGVMGAVPVLGHIFSLVDVCLIFREDRRCVHDLIADTVVVKAA